MFKKLKRMVQESGGGAIVEFALVLPILVNILFTTFELGIILAIKICLENGTTQAARFGSTGATTTGYTRLQSITNIMTSYGGVLIAPTSITTTVTSYPSFSVIPLLGTAGAGTGLQVVTYVSSYTYVPITPIVAAFFGSSHTLTLTAYGKNDNTF